MKTKLALLSLFVSTLTFSEVVNLKKFDIEVPSQFMVPYSGDESEFKDGFKTGFGSALAFKNINSDGTIEFYALTDRGPNADIPKYLKDGKSVPGKFFPAPNFTPSIGILKVDDKKAEIIDKIELKDSTGKNITGLPLPLNRIGSTGEVALDLNMNSLGYDINGLDPEGIAIDKDGNFWISDEYGPFIIKVDKNGKILEKLEPGNGLPEIVKHRIPNRGIEGLTIDKNGNIYAAVQSTLNVDGKTKDTAIFTRVLKINPDTKEVKTFAYPIDKNYKSNSAAKIGDIYAVDENKLLIIEQGKQKGKMENLIYLVDFSKADDITTLGNLESKGNDLKIKLGEKKLVVDLRKHGWDTEKAEGLTLLPDNKTIAIINDNDFGMAISEDVSPYHYNENEKQLYLNNKATNQKLTLKKNTETSQLWLVTLKEEI
ncbi:esterase-like activity of phytase family protein (plasmid) [Cetobacterium somerae]|uniref:esterase-like activity of phytase family protein n=1 Tax=Cetobacterium somerae TaxID=188913 RepID=UPI002E7C339E|nr:esterase-like activity of phytase family protein [Cetobacterium somerae]WVJ02930.1 esterase-like activity of phytase family protein [Cetobacterium somerae]